MYYYNFECIRFHYKYTHSIRGKIKSNLKSVFCSTFFEQHSPINMGLKIFKDMELDTTNFILR